MLVLAHGASGESASAQLDRLFPASQSPSQAGELALRSLSPGERASLSAALRELVDQLHAQVNPLALDLTETALGARLGKLSPGLLPSMTAASALGEGRFATGDGSLAVAVAASCPPRTRGLDCVPAWSDTHATGELGQARFLAWPIARAILLRAADAASANALASRLKEAMPRADTRIALVLGVPDLVDATEPPDIADARLQSARAAAFLRRSPRPGLAILESLAAAPLPGPRLPWFSTRPDEVLVIPRLRAAADLRPFVAEVEALLRAASLEPAWVVTPH